MNLVAAAGGSGGHCYPAIAFLQACKNRHPDWTLTLVVDRGSRTMGLELDAAAASSVREVESAKFAGMRSVLSPGFWFKMLRGTREARALLKELKADVVVGFGGYGSFPAMWEATSLRIPTILHEQNAVMGTANRVLKGRVTRVAVSLEPADSTGTAGAAAKGRLGGKNAGRVVRTGFPLRSSLRRMDADAVRRRFGLDPAKKTLLAFGGSQGSRFINDLITDAMDAFGKELLQTWQVLHLTGRAAAGKSAGPDLLSGGYRRWTYSREMDALYTAADLAVCRAGSATLHELSYYGKPAILVPYPYAQGHQLKNARVLADCGAAWILEEKECTLEQFKGLLQQAAANPEQLKSMGRACSTALKTDGCEALVDLVEQIR